MRPSLIPGLVAAAQKNADRGFADVALFEVGQVFKGDQPEDQFTAAAGVRRALREARAAAAAIGRTRPAKSMRSTPRPMRSRCSPRPARRRRRCRSCRAGRPGFIPAAPARSRSGRRTCSAISANCIRARSKRSTPRGRWSAFEVILERIPEAEGQSRRAPSRVLELSPFQPVERDFAFVVDRDGEGRPTSCAPRRTSTAS